MGKPKQLSPSFGREWENPNGIPVDWDGNGKSKILFWRFWNIMGELIKTHFFRDNFASDIESLRS